MEEKEIKQIEAISEEEIISRLMVEYKAPEKVYLVERLNVPFELKGLTEKEITKIKEQCTYRGVLNANEFDAGLIVAAVTNFKFNNEQLLKHYTVSSAKELVRRILLAGEIVGLTQAILKLSGFGNSVEEVEFIKKK